jgi:hypothetical protein
MSAFPIVRREVSGSAILRRLMRDSDEATQVVLLNTHDISLGLLPIGTAWRLFSRAA